MIKRLKSQVANTTKAIIDSPFINYDGKRLELNNEMVKSKMQEIIDRFANEPLLLGPLAFKKSLESISIMAPGENNGQKKISLRSISIISNQDANTFAISLIDQKFIKSTCSAIDSSDKNVKTMLDSRNPNKLLVTFPKLTIETKNSMVKQETAKSNNFRKELRVLRQDIIKDINQSITDGDVKRKSELDLEKIVDIFTELIDKALSRKREEILK